MTSSATQQPSADAAKFKKLLYFDNFEELPKNAIFFRSAIIDEFRLNDTLTGGRVRAPVHNSNDIMDNGIRNRVMIENPAQPVSFVIYKTSERAESNMIDRRLLYVQNRNRLPLAVWCRWIVENDMFQYFMLWLIIGNSVVMGLQSELPSTPEVYAHIQSILEMFDLFSLYMFVLEILLKWADNFVDFWSSGWNIFDFLVTVVSAIPEVLRLFMTQANNGDNNDVVSQIAAYIRTFKILRSLKMIARFGSLKIIVMTILQAFQSMVFILVLLLSIAYIFAIMAVVFFNTDNPELNEFQGAFDNLYRAMITLFQLFTMDQWYALLKYLWIDNSKFESTLYIILWVLFGAFIFKNIFVGIMVNNFQDISREITSEQDQALAEEAKELARLELLEELNQAEMEGTGEDDETMSTVHSETSCDGGAMGRTESEVEWERMLKANMEALDDPSKLPEVAWPKELLYRYYIVMEKISLNLQEGEEIQKLLVFALLSMNDY
ncbi:cation channel sperm-associated protein 2-like [Bolinopsis microptera]|uniref:cation channel sperm-associated protein 2-like n=1 Tax=Bolinopsis microptera TaxID=2820187 RepID=UPI00307ACE55